MPLNFKVPADFRREFKTYAANTIRKLNQLLYERLQRSRLNMLTSASFWQRGGYFHRENSMFAFCSPVGYNTKIRAVLWNHMKQKHPSLFERLMAYGDND